MRSGEFRPRFSGQFLERAVTQIPEKHPRALVRVLRKFLLDSRIRAAGHHENVRISVVIQIDDPRSPADVVCLRAEVRRVRHIIKITFAIIAVENIRVVREVRLKKIEMPVEIIIADADSHPGLFHSVFIQSDATRDAFFAERSVMVVHEKQTWR